MTRLPSIPERSAKSQRLIDLPAEEEPLPPCKYMHCSCVASECVMERMQVQTKLEVSLLRQLSATGSFLSTVSSRLFRVMGGTEAMDNQKPWLKEKQSIHDTKWI
jgi:hypothetical protein